MAYHLQDDIHDRPVPAKDLANLFLGPLISRGMTRWVFEHAMDDSLVIKMEAETPPHKVFQNQMEWIVWCTVKESPELRKWFAPCVTISDYGVFLIQKRIKPIPKEKYPDRIPDFFNDTKYLNFGMLGKSFVCCDYGILFGDHLLAKTKRLTKAVWWGE